MVPRKGRDPRDGERRGDDGPSSDLETSNAQDEELRLEVVERTSSET